MAFSLGVWAVGPLPDGVLYRWEADEGRTGSGFLVLLLSGAGFRPADSQGNPVGDLRLDADTGQLTGEAAGVDRALFLKVSAAILKGFRRTGKAPDTAHSYFG